MGRLRHARASKAGSRSPDADARRREDALRQARQALGPDRARAAEQRGAAMSLATAAEYVLMLTAPGPRAGPGGTGLGRLSARERELVTLVAQGRTDAADRRRSCTSASAPSARTWTGSGTRPAARRRADLTRLALSAGLV